MGYYTHFEIEAFGEDAENVIEAVKDKSQYRWDDDDLFDAKWYEYKDDCQFVMDNFPNATLVVSGYGEEDGDIWRHWFKRGKDHYSKATFIFDEPDW